MMIHSGNSVRQKYRLFQIIPAPPISQVKITMAAISMKFGVESVDAGYSLRVVFQQSELLNLGALQIDQMKSQTEICPSVTFKFLQSS